jgi:chemotaxis signal transduction protein
VIPDPLNRPALADKRNVATGNPPALSSPAPGFKSYLTFRVARQDFAIDAGRVRGILPSHDLVMVPRTRPALAGIASLGGRPLAVFDLRVKLGLPQGSQGSQPRIVVIEVIVGEGRRHLAGFIADRVSDVVMYRDRDLSHGALRGNGRPRRLLDPDQIASEDELMCLWSAN